MSLARLMGFSQRASNRPGFSAFAPSPGGLALGRTIGLSKPASRIPWTIAHFDDGLGWWHEQFAQLFADPLVLVVEAAVWKDFSHAVPDLSGKQGCWLQVCNVGWARH
jgi:hypothetical protein